MKKILIVFLTFIISTVTFSQDAFSEGVKKCIQSNGTYAYYDDVADQMFTMLEEKYASEEVPNTVWNELKGMKTTSLENLSQMIISAYRGHFSLEDVNNMNTLYESETGKKMLKNNSNLSETEKNTITEFYSSETGQKITGSQESMNSVMGQISATWSSDFFRQVVDKLSEKGYNL